MRVLEQIPRIPLPSSDLFQQQYVARDRPVIIEGGLSSWPALSAWSAEGLSARIGDIQTRFKSSPTHRHPDFGFADPAVAFASGESTFAELITRLVGNPSEAARLLLTGEEEFLIKRRAGAPELRNDKLEPLFADFKVPELFDEASLYSCWFWMSGRGVRTWLHYDNNGCHNLNAQVQGEKQVWLIPPDQLPLTYPFPVDGGLPAYNCCRLDIEAPQIEKYPDCAGLQSYHGELRSGDLLFIPANWIHSFLHTGRFNVNVNFWWKPSQLVQSLVSNRQSLIDAAGGVVGIRALNEERRAYLAELEATILQGKAVSHYG